MSAPDEIALKVSRTGTGVGGSGGAGDGRAESVAIGGGSHLVPLEKPSEVAHEVVGWLVREMRRWKGAEEKWRREWEEEMPRRGQITVSDEHFDKIGARRTRGPRKEGEDRGSVPSVSKLKL